MILNVRIVFAENARWDLHLHERVIISAVTISAVRKSNNVFIIHDVGVWIMYAIKNVARKSLANE